MHSLATCISGIYISHQVRSRVPIIIFHYFKNNSPSSSSINSTTIHSAFLWSMCTCRLPKEISAEVMTHENITCFGSSQVSTLYELHHLPHDILQRQCSGISYEQQIVLRRLRKHQCISHWARAHTLHIFGMLLLSFRLIQICFYAPVWTLNSL
jgi:hypothetical protein